MVLIPVIILIVFSLGIIILQAIRPRIGISLLLAVIGSSLAWFAVLILHWQIPLSIHFPAWLPGVGWGGQLFFDLDTISWPYIFGLISLDVAVILTASARLRPGFNPRVWAVILAITGLAIVACVANSPIAIVLAWTVVDIMELIVLLATVEKPEFNWQIILAFGVRVTGTFVVIWAMIASRSQGEVLSLSTLSTKLSLYFLLAVGLRLGVFPLHLPYNREKLLRRGLGTIIRLVSPVCSLVVLNRLPSVALPFQWVSILIFFSVATALYGALLWVNSEDELSGRPYLLLTLASFAIASTIREQQQASAAWGTALIFVGGLLPLYSARSKSILVIPLLGILGLSGLPFTPAAGGWSGLISAHFGFVDTLFILAHLLLLEGYLRHVFLSGESFKYLEKWVHFVYPLGLSVLISSHWIVGVLGGNNLLTAGVWWAGIISSSLAVGLWMLIVRVIRPRLLAQEGVSRFLNVGRIIINALERFFQFNWLFQIFGFVFHLIQRLVLVISNILEGQGGILWTCLLLVLLFSILNQGGKP